MWPYSWWPFSSSLAVETTTYDKLYTEYSYTRGAEVCVRLLTVNSSSSSPDSLCVFLRFFCGKSVQNVQIVLSSDVSTFQDVPIRVGFTMSPFQDVPIRVASQCPHFRMSRLERPTDGTMHSCNVSMHETYSSWLGRGSSCDRLLPDIARDLYKR